MKMFVITILSVISCYAFAAPKAYRKPATYDIDTKTAAERSAKAICEISNGEGCVIGKAVCKDTSVDDTTTTARCKVVVNTVKGQKMPGGLDYTIEILNGRVSEVREHCGMCD